MMKIYCDRCGKEIDAAGASSLSVFLSEYPVGKNLDFCSECQKEIYDFVFSHSARSAHPDCSHPKQLG